MISEIDAVITWVDGAQPAHLNKRMHYMAAAEKPLHGNAINPHRWADSDELGYCLRAIEHNAPWIRRVWIVTDDQQPRLPALSSAFRAKISMIDHSEIFAGHEQVLPTFNSLTIETMLWRIKGIAEHFLYFNDDVFITRAVQPSDFFTPAGPVLRGYWADYSALVDCPIKRLELALLNHFNQINSANRSGYGADRIFLSAHVVHPMKKSVMATLFAEHREAFIENIAHRFRCTGQFLPQSLHNHACIRDGSATILEANDYLHLPVGMFDENTLDQVRANMRTAAAPAIKFLCVNDLPALEQNIGNARAWIEQTIGLGVDAGPEKRRIA
jgi:hypothetical protein